MAQNVNEINDRLRKIYGVNPFKMPLFRLVFSDREVEKRHGTFIDWYGKIFVRQYTGVREVPKYNYLKAKWILERWMPPSFQPEIDALQGTYEPIYVFQDAMGNSLPIIEDFTHQVIERLHNPLLPGHRMSILQTQKEEEYRKEIEYSLLVMEEASPLLAGKLHAGEAIVRP